MLTCFVRFISAQNMSLDWAKQLSHSTNVLLHAYLKADATGNLYALGLFTGTVDVDPGPAVNVLTCPTNSVNIYSYYILKLDVNGNFVWARQIDNLTICAGRPLSIDAQGNLLMFGSFNGISDFDPGPATYTLDGANGSMFVCQFSSSGNFMWARQMGAVSTQTPFSGALYSITSDVTGNIFLSGAYSGVADFDPSPTVYTLSTASPTTANGFVCKLDVNANFVWARQFVSVIGGGSGANYIRLDALGNCYVTGSATGGTDFDPGPGAYTLSAPSTTMSLYLACLDGSGNLNWVDGFQNLVSPQQAICDAAGNSYLVGQFSGTVDVDPGASVYNLISAGGSDGYIIKLNNLGGFAWAGQFAGPALDAALDVVQDLNTNIYISGSFQSQSDLDPSATVFTCIASGNRDGFITKIDASGNFIWARQFGSTGNFDDVENLACSAGDLYASGDFQNTVDFDPCSTTQTLTAISPGIFGDIFMMKLASVAAPQAVNATPASDLLICDGAATTLSATSQGTVSWFDSPVYTGTALSTGNALVTPTLGIGNYTYYATASDNCGTSNTPAVIIITVNAIPQVSVSATNSLICRGQTATLSALGANSYLWSDGSAGTVIVVSPSVTTSYTLTGTNPGNCSNAEAYTLSVSVCLGLDTEWNHQINLLVYPNPNFGELRLMSPDNAIYLIELYNLTGQLLVSDPVSSEQSLLLPDLSDGVLFYTIKQNNTIKGNGKLILDRSR